MFVIIKKDDIQKEKKIINNEFDQVPKENGIYYTYSLIKFSNIC